MIIGKNIDNQKGGNKQNLDELIKITLLNILSVKGVLYTYYNNKQRKKGVTNEAILDNRTSKINKKIFG